MKTKNLLVEEKKVKIKELDKDKKKDGINEKTPRIKRKHEEHANLKKKEDSKKVYTRRVLAK